MPHSWLDSGSTATLIRPPLERTSLKKVSLAAHTPPKRESLTVTPSLVPGLHMTGTFKAASGSVWALMVERSALALRSGTPERSQAAATRSGCMSTMPPAQCPPPLWPQSAQGNFDNSGCPDFAPRSTRHF